MSRPELPPLKRGDTLIVHGGVSGYHRRTVEQASEVRVVTVGREYVYVIPSARFDDFDPAKDHWYLRKFLLADQREGEPGSRSGHSATIATAEQHAYDRTRAEALSYLDDQGFTLRSSSPWRGREVELATLIRKPETGA